MKHRRLAFSHSFADQMAAEKSKLPIYQQAHRRMPCSTRSES